MTKRLDAVVAERGLARSRTHAAQLIDAGLVSVDGRPVVKAATRIGDEQEVAVAASDHYVSRAAHKLIAALDAFDVRVAARLCLDMGASTGGFTQVLLERGAARVLAVDVGHGQLAPELAAADAVSAVEGFNVRYMTPDSLAAAVGGVAAPPSLVTGDLSFISLTHVLPAVAAVASTDADVVLLVKPQFEVGRSGVREGLVTDAAARADAVMGVLWAAWDAGFGTRGVIASPIAGTHGNQEFLVHLRPAATLPAAGVDGNPTEYLEAVNELAGAK
ncbi:MAG: TlyA family RNA methyltransferase [Microbacterium sp.]|uniref:TlyA family RNA methyltransferase n=1 Tax=Microbacterium sp. TaxID=51671 RepID=UPI001AD45893|nr:TlyA family RNA methyltransferase [Microbacterium sp.]MBN9176921.1 TlyA family RNA methyltransferase [Microbacterium sp.]